MNPYQSPGTQVESGHWITCQGLFVISFALFCLFHLIPKDTGPFCRLQCNASVPLPGHAGWLDLGRNLMHNHSAPQTFLLVAFQSSTNSRLVMLVLHPEQQLWFWRITKPCLPHWVPINNMCNSFASTLSTASCASQSDLNLEGVSLHHNRPGLIDFEFLW